MDEIPDVPRPALRPLKIFPTDPTQGYARARRATILVENEPLMPGPVGERLEVIDYDGQGKTFYPPVDLDDDAILMQGGSSPRRETHVFINKWSTQLPRGRSPISIVRLDDE